MAEKTNYTWYVKDKVYIDIDIIDGSATSTARDAKYLKELLMYGQFEKEAIGVARRIDKFLCLNEVYTYMYNEGYLTDSRYAEDTFYDEQEGSFNFILNVTKLAEDYDIQSELCEAFPYKFPMQYIHMLFNPLSYHRCPVCGAYVFSSTYNAGKIADNDFKCNDCKDLSNNQAERIKQVRKNKGVLSAIEANSRKLQSVYA